VGGPARSAAATGTTSLWLRRPMCWPLRAETTPESGACPPRTVPRRGRRARGRLAVANHILCAGRLCVLAGNVDAPLPRRLHRGFVTLLPDPACRRRQRSSLVC